MTNSDDHRDTHKELQRLLVAVVLGDASEGELERLNILLCTDSDLRCRAARFLEEEAVLRNQFQILDRVRDFHTSLPTTDDRLSDSVVCAARAHQNKLKAWTRQRTPFLLLASVLFVAIGFSLWQLNYIKQVGAGSGDEATASHSPGDEQLPLRPLGTAEVSMLPPVTRVSWSGPQFASNIGAPTDAFRLREGVVRFVSLHDRRAEGFMIHLPPSALLDLVVTADAEGENSLAVIEFDSDGTPTGRRLSFSNSLAEVVHPTDSDASIGGRTRFGPIGTWTERNNGSRSKYYCFISVHKLLDRAEDDSWHESRLAVQLEERNLAHIGWDDSGMADVGEPDAAQVPDLDFDDLSATIRIYRPDAESDSRVSDVRVLPERAAATAVVGINDGFPVSIGAGEAVFVKVTNRFSTPATIAVVDKKTGQVWWSYVPTKTASSSGGVCALENTSSDPREFVVVGRQNLDLDGSGHKSKRMKASIRFQQDAFTSLLFDEGPDDPDFDDVKVDIVNMIPL